MTDRDLYRILQVDPEADADVITAAFRTLARKVHPDRDVTGANGAALSELNRAYATLRDPDARRVYDAQRAARNGPVPVGPGDPNQVPLPPVANRWAWRHAEPEPATQLKLDFGRYSGWSVKDLASYDPDYLRWLYRHSAGGRYRHAIAELIKDVTADDETPVNPRLARR